VPSALAPTDKLATIGAKVMGWHVSFGAMSPVSERELRTDVSLLFVYARSHKFTLACGTQHESEPAGNILASSLLRLESAEF
jgi:hypothetical protein